MGRGKGGIHLWYANIKVNQILFEFSHTDISLAYDIASLVTAKLPIRSQLITKNDTKRINS